MNVKELINKLMEHPLDMEVWLEYDSGWWKIKENNIRQEYLNEYSKGEFSIDHPCDEDHAKSLKKILHIG